MHPPRDTQPARRRRVAPLVVGALIIVVSAAGFWWNSTRLPRRFAAVVEGRLYRSGEVTPAHLERLQRDFGIERIVCLLNSTAPVTLAEADAARRLGLQWRNIPLTGDGASEPADRARILELLLDDDAPTTLVHCAAGANRTGLAIGLYRLHAQGWPLDRVMDELRQFGFEDLPKHANLRQALADAATEAAP